MNEKKCSTPCQCIHEYCKTRCFTSQKAIRGCDDLECPLYKYRLGKNPKRKKGYRTTFPPKKRQSESDSAMYKGKTKPVEVNVEGKKKIRLIVEDIE